MINLTTLRLGKDKENKREFSGGLVVRIQCCHCCGPGSIPGGELRSCKPCGEAKIKKKIGEFPGNPVVRLGSFNAVTWIQSHAVRPKNKNKQTTETNKIGNTAHEDEKILNCINSKRSEN